MAICQVMIGDFLHRWGRFDESGEELYDKDNLIEAIQYCQDLKDYEGLKVEPYHGYDLNEFIAWAKARL